MAILFINVFSKSYFAPLFSISGCVCLALVIFVLILPFFAAVSTDGFWTTYQIYNEQPAITFNNEMIAYILENDTPRYFTTIDLINKFATNPLVSPTIKVNFIIKR